MGNILKITQVRSIIGTQRKKHRVVMESLGFRKNYATLYKKDTPQIRGMLRKVRHLVVWEEVDESSIPSRGVSGQGFSVVDLHETKESKEP